MVAAAVEERAAGEETAEVSDTGQTIWIAAGLGTGGTVEMAANAAVMIAALECAHWQLLSAQWRRTDVQPQGSEA